MGLESIARVDAAPIDLRVCGASPVQTCPVVTPGAELDPDADAGTTLDPEIEPCQAPDLGTPPQALEGSAVECAQLALAVDGGEHIVSGVSIRNVNLRVSVTQPTRVTFEDGTFEAVFLDLQGPITLRIERSRSVTSLGAVGKALGAGRPRIELVDVDATEMRTGTVDATFDGEIALDRVELTGAQLLADRLDLQSAAFVESRIEARALTATDLQVSTSSLVLGDAVLSAFSLTDSALERCDSLDLIAGVVKRSAIAACAGPPVRVYATKVLASRVDGRFELDESSWQNVALGSTAPTDVIAFGSVLLSLNFCEHAARPRLGDQTALTCSECDGWDESHPPPCWIGEHAADEKKARKNYCERLDAASFEACPEPVPERLRPLKQPF